MPLRATTNLARSDKMIHPDRGDFIVNESSSSDVFSRTSLGLVVPGGHEIVALASVLIMNDWPWT